MVLTIPAFSAPASLATRYEAEIGAAMLANVRPKSKPQPMGRPPAPEPVEAASTTDRIIAALRSMRGQEGTLGDIERHMPDVKPGAIRLSLSQAKASGKLSMTGRSSFGIWRVREAVERVVGGNAAEATGLPPEPQVGDTGVSVP